jgi:hypothetical protein
LAAIKHKLITRRALFDLIRSVRLAAAANFDLQNDRSDLHGPFGHNGVEGCSPRPFFRGELNE